MTIIQEHIAESANEFLELLNPRGTLLRHYPETDNLQKWIFRGQSSSEWLLLPTAFRKDGKRILSGLTNPAGDNPYEKNRKSAQCYWEARALSAFIEIADSQGLPIPEDGQLMRNLLHACLCRLASAAIPGSESVKKPLRHVDIEEWPPLEVLSVLGIAQHSGIPTRLLDWSYSSYIAAYFAAIGASERVHTDERGSPSATLFVTILSFCCESKCYINKNLRSSSPVRCHSYINEFEPFYGNAVHSHPQSGSRTTELTEKIQTEIFWRLRTLNRGTQ